MTAKSVEEIQAVILQKIPKGRIVPEHTETAHFYRDTQTGNKFASVTTKSGILDAPHLKKWAARLAVEYYTANANSVTDIEKLKGSAILAHQDQFQEAGDIGTQGHEIIEEYMNQWLISKRKPQSMRKFLYEHRSQGRDTRLHAIARSAEMFFNDFFVEPIATELLVASNRHGFAGTLDALGMVGLVTKEGVPSPEQLNESGKCPHSLWLLSRSQLKYECIHCGMQVIKKFCLIDWKTSNSIDKVDYAMQVSAYYQALWEMTGLRPKEIIIVRLDKNKAAYEIRRVVNRVAAFRSFKQLSKVYDWLSETGEKLEKFPPKKRTSLSSLPTTMQEV